MSTRSVVGAVTESGSVGVYVHSDGYPSWNGVQVQTILARDGYDKFVETVLNTQGFSFLEASTGVQPARLGDRGKVIPGYGEAYNDAPGTELLSLEQVIDDVMIEYAYFVRADGKIDAYALSGYAEGGRKKWVIEPDTEVTDEPPADAVAVDSPVTTK